MYIRPLRSLKYIDIFILNKKDGVIKSEVSSYRVQVKFLIIKLFLNQWSPNFLFMGDSKMTGFNGLRGERERGNLMCNQRDFLNTPFLF